MKKYITTFAITLWKCTNELKKIINKIKIRKVGSAIDGVNNRPADIQVILHDNELSSIYHHDFLLVGFFTHLLQ